MIVWIKDWIKNGLVCIFRLDFVVVLFVRDGWYVLIFNLGIPKRIKNIIKNVRVSRVTISSKKISLSKNGQNGWQLNFEDWRCFRNICFLLMF